MILEANPEQRIDRAWLERYYVRRASGNSIPLAALMDNQLDLEVDSRASVT